MTLLLNCITANPPAFSWTGGIFSVLWTVRLLVLYKDSSVSCHSWWPVLSDFQWTFLAFPPSWLSLLISFLPPNFYSADEVLGYGTAKLQTSSVFALSKCTERAFSSLPRHFTTQSLMNTHCLGNLMSCSFLRKTCSFPSPVGRNSPCCALLKNPGSEQTWVAVHPAGNDCCCHLRCSPSCIWCYIWKNHWSKYFWLSGFFCKWKLQSCASLMLSRFSLFKALGGIHLYK